MTSREIFAEYQTSTDQNHLRFDFLKEWNIETIPVCKIPPETYLIAFVRRSLQNIGIRLYSEINGDFPLSTIDWQDAEEVFFVKKGTCGHFHCSFAKTLYLDRNIFEFLHTWISIRENFDWGSGSGLDEQYQNIQSRMKKALTQFITEQLRINIW